MSVPAKRVRIFCRLGWNDSDSRRSAKFSPEDLDTCIMRWYIPSQPIKCQKCADTCCQSATKIFRSDPDSTSFSTNREFLNRRSRVRLTPRARTTKARNIRAFAVCAGSCYRLMQRAGQMSCAGYPAWPVSIEGCAETCLILNDSSHPAQIRRAGSW
jgi:hypothetical protein